MRLWHQALIHYLDSKRLLGQHRECCALRGRGWGRKHATVDYVFKYDRSHLYQYHVLVIHEIITRGYKVSTDWLYRLYRGSSLPCDTLLDAGIFVNHMDESIYEEHNDSYLRECLLNLKSKGAELVNGKTIDGMLIDLDLKENNV